MANRVKRLILDEPVAAPVAEPIAEPVAVPERKPDGVGDRGVEQGVPFVIDGAGRKFVADGHKDAGDAW